jgi:pimeloyl-ACP methyl ester carboxylesterase/putative sterol carrier protein
VTRPVTPPAPRPATTRRDPATVAPAPDPAAVRASLVHLAERFLPSEARGLTATYVIHLDGLQPYTIEIGNGRCLVAAGEPVRWDARLHADPVAWLDVVSGRVDGIRAFQLGRLKVRGDLGLAVRLETLFTPGTEATRLIRTRTTTVKGVPIESLVGGAGTPVVLIHGLAASKVTFVPTLDALADDYEVHALDLPGFGKSGKPLPAGRRYTPAWFADVVRDYLVANGIDRAVLIGNSMGGRIATEVALRHPHHVHGIVGLGAAVAFDEWQRLRHLLRLVRFQWSGAIPVRLPASVLERAIRGVFHDPGRLPHQNFRSAVDDAQLQLRQAGYRMAVAAAARGLVTDPAGGRSGYWERLAGLDLPSLWIWGRSDRLVSHRYGHRVASVLPHAEVEVWDDCGHVPQFELPERTHATIGAFLQRVLATA